MVKYQLIYEFGNVISEGSEAQMKLVLKAFETYGMRPDMFAIVPLHEISFNDWLEKCGELLHEHQKEEFGDLAARLSANDMLDLDPEMKTYWEEGMPPEKFVESWIEFGD